MTEQLPPIYFYVPAEKWPNPFPDCATQLRTGYGTIAWILQTYLKLQESGFACELVGQIPEEGIVIAHRESITYDFRPNSKLLLACVKGDQNPQPYAQIHIVQNRQEVDAFALKVQSLAEERYLLPGKRYFLPHWPQPGLIPRDLNREDQFENVVYFGITYNLARPLRTPEWRQQIENLGLIWSIETDKDRWHDYYSADVILAIRSFDSQETYPWKPPTKLYNAWLAGVPAILGRESAFEAERQHELDFFNASDPQEVIQILSYLRDNSQVRRKMAEHYQERAKTIDTSYLVKCWRTFILETCIPAYQQWCSLSAREQQQFFLRRRLAVKFNQLQMKTLRLLNRV